MSDCTSQAVTKLGVTRILNPCLQFPFQGAIVLLTKPCVCGCLGRQFNALISSFFSNKSTVSLNSVRTIITL